MSILKKIALLIALVLVAVVDILVYWNQHLYYQAERIEKNEKKIEILERANKFSPFNDLVFYELGKAYFDLGIRSLNDEAKSRAYLQESIKNFKHSIRINPASQYSHFNLGQSLLYTSFFSPSLDVNCYEEYKKAAVLVDHNSQIFYDVGKIFLSRWDELSDENREFTIEILRKVVGTKDSQELRSIMQTWEMNIKDYDVMEKILPEDPQIYRMYAEYLGEKSLSAEERQKILADAELLEFERAKSKHDSGENAYLYFQMKEALNHFKSCLNILEEIKFYQNLTLHNHINRSEYSELLKSSFLNLAKCRLEEGEDLKEVESYLQKYLALEDKVAAVSRLESFLRDRGLIGEKLNASFDNLESLFFQLSLYFKQNRYRDIVRIGRILQQSLVIVPEGKREVYVKILQLVGDSYQKVDYIYDAGEFYQKALEVDPENLETLLRIRQNYERLNADEKIQEVKEKIDRLISPAERVFENLTINKGRSSWQTLALDGRKIILDLHFKSSSKRIAPLITVFFNGCVVWEDYLKDEVLSLPLESKVGKNSLQIVPVNRAVSLVKLEYK